MRGERPNGAVGRGGKFGLPPSVPAVARNVQAARIAGRAAAIADKYGLRIVGLVSDAPAVAVREMRRDVLRFPRFALVHADVEVVVSAGKDCLRARIGTRQNGQRMNVGRTHALVAAFPGFASVRAAPQAVNLHARPNNVRV